MPLHLLNRYVVLLCLDQRASSSVFLFYCLLLEVFLIVARQCFRMLLRSCFDFGHRVRCFLRGFLPAMGSSSSSPEDVIFFPDKSLPCVHYLAGEACTRKRCSFAHEETGLVRVLNQFKTARRSIDVCVFTLTCDEV